jgi:ribonuclease Z
MTMAFVTGRTSKIKVFGPPGIEEVMAGFHQAYKLDRGYRVTHHYPLLNGDFHGFEVIVVPKPAPDEQTMRIEVENKCLKGLRTFAFQVDHGPVSPAYGYRFEVDKAVIVVSGDTKWCPSLVRNCSGARVVVQEALCCQLMQMVSDVNKTAQNVSISKIAKDVINYHTSIQECIDIAATCDVPVMLLTHLVPAPTNFLLRRFFFSEVSRPPKYAGRVLLGEDGTSASVDVHSGQISIAESTTGRTMTRLRTASLTTILLGCVLSLLQLINQSDSNGTLPTDMTCRSAIEIAERTALVHIQLATGLVIAGIIGVMIVAFNRLEL